MFKIDALALSCAPGGRVALAWLNAADRQVLLMWPQNYAQRQARRCSRTLLNMPGRLAEVGHRPQLPSASGDGKEMEALLAKHVQMLARPWPSSV